MSKIVKCKTCQAEIAADAKACPKCGSPNKGKVGCLKIFVIGFGVFIALGIIGSILDDKKGTGTSSAASNSKSSSAPAQSTQSFKIGDTVTFDDSEWVVIKARNLGSTLSGGEFVEAKKSDGKFIYVRYKLVNKTAEQQAVLFTPSVKDSKGRKFEELDDLRMYLGNGETGMTLEQLPAGLTKTFSAIFEVPSDASELAFMTRSFAAFRSQEKAVQLGF